MLFVKITYITSGDIGQSAPASIHVCRKACTEYKKACQGRTLEEVSMYKWSLYVVVHVVNVARPCVIVVVEMQAV